MMAAHLFSLTNQCAQVQPAITITYSGRSPACQQETVHVLYNCTKPLFSQILLTVITDVMFFLHRVFLSSYQGFAVKEPYAQPSQNNELN